MRTTCINIQYPIHMHNPIPIRMRTLIGNRPTMYTINPIHMHAYRIRIPTT